MGAALEIADLSVRFLQRSGFVKRRLVLGVDRATLSVNAGEVVALVGGSGAGKSLLLHAVLGLLPKNASETGTIRIDGQTVDVNARRDLCGRRLALVPQSVTHLDPMATIGRQIEWAFRRAGRTGDGGEAGVARILAETRLPPGIVDRYPSEISGGMARRVLLSIALVPRSGTLLADEPTNGLDAEAAGLVFSRLRTEAEEGRAVLVVTHDLAGILPFADRIVLIENGRVLGEERRDDFTGTGNALATPYARKAWNALPANGFRVLERTDHA